MDSHDQTQETGSAVTPMHLFVTTMAIIVALAMLVLCQGCGSSTAPASKPTVSESITTTEGTDPSASSPDPSATASDTASPSATPTQDATAVVPLHVKGARLVDDQDRPRQLRGVSTHGIAWYPQYVDGTLFAWLRQDWGINVVRLAMYTAEQGGYCTDGNRTQLMQLVRKGIDAAVDNGLYVIVDWHILSDGDPNTHVAEARGFFDEVSKAYPDTPNVLYEICNEPNGGTTWQQVKDYADQVIPVIRANAPDSVVLVGTPNWSQDIGDATQDPLDYDNVMYTLHFYAGTHGADLRERMLQAVEAGTPVFVSEFGTTNADGNGAVDLASAQAWVEAMDEHGISYVIWSLSDKQESSALFTNGDTMQPGPDDLSEQGRWYREHLRSVGGLG